eukprot:scaffold169846_cov33-Tisochrysis_lutea.AAC.1
MLYCRPFGRLITKAAFGRVCVLTATGKGHMEQYAASHAREPRSIAPVWKESRGYGGKRGQSVLPRKHPSHLQLFGISIRLSQLRWTEDVVLDVMQQPWRDRQIVLVCPTPNAFSPPACHCRCFQPNAVPLRGGV